MQFSFGMYDRRLPGMVKVSYPYLAGVVVLSKRFVSDMALGVDVQLPKK